MDTCLQSAKKHLPRVLHVLRLIHSDCEFDLEVLIRAVFGDCHFVPLRLFGAVWGGVEDNLEGESTHFFFLSENRSNTQSWLLGFDTLM